MKNSTLVFRSLAIVVIILGSLWLITDAYQDAGYNYQSDNIITENQDSVKEKTIPPKPNIDFTITGKWKVAYNDESFKGVIVYEIKKKGNSFHANIFEYQDEEGNTQKAEDDKVLTIKSFDGIKGKGMYMIVFEEDEYRVKCNIDVLDENTFKLSYDYYGYSDTEIWKRL
ncbi:hypothetical protein A9Q86_10055 [Flavobacteriales bacterium 33_180_T64]|nr:hypothetical protein A9Q86_10055 [Flavobacteriales bacterium 33_180_T64]